MIPQEFALLVIQSAKNVLDLLNKIAYPAILLIFIVKASVGLNALLLAIQILVLIHANLALNIAEAV